ncbi:ureidoglycolate hydrolase [Ascobolus immersus RN42]|uniref:Ureidoglycolate hydrolase n=1 Tax=Ascobolus immersus RN42 TaxID=1160509 RepID=A0A3N4ILW0_ASCIM|nr:ureidoglycolate hydrolase [Ascobolus immersus RN42]
MSSPPLVPCEPLTSASFQSFGAVIENPQRSNPNHKVRTVNQSTALKYRTLPSFGHDYPASGAQPNLTTNIFVCKPRELKPADTAKNLPPRYVCSVLEKHPYTRQAFIPLGVKPGVESPQYVVIVAPDDGKGKPDWSSLKAFLADGSQGIAYGAGVWHSPMVVVGSGAIEFVCLVWENGVDDEDTVEVRGGPVDVCVSVDVVGGSLAKAKL